MDMVKIKFTEIIQIEEGHNKVRFKFGIWNGKQ